MCTRGSCWNNYILKKYVDRRVEFDRFSYVYEEYGYPVCKILFDSRFVYLGID